MSEVNNSSVTKPSPFSISELMKPSVARSRESVKANLDANQQSDVSQVARDLVRTHGENQHYSQLMTQLIGKIITKVDAESVSRLPSKKKRRKNSTPQKVEKKVESCQFSACDEEDMTLQEEPLDLSASGPNATRPMPSIADGNFNDEYQSCQSSPMEGQSSEHLLSNGSQTPDVSQQLTLALESQNCPTSTAGAAFQRNNGRLPIDAPNPAIPFTPGPFPWLPGGEQSASQNPGPNMALMRGLYDTSLWQQQFMQQGVETAAGLTAAMQHTFRKSPARSSDVDDNNNKVVTPPPPATATHPPFLKPNSPVVTSPTTAAAPEKKSPPVNCPFCDRVFNFRSKLLEHLPSHSGARPFQCSFVDCTKSYKYKYDLFQHIRTHYGVNVKTKDCNRCGSSFDSHQRMLEHMATAHNCPGLVAPTLHMKVVLPPEFAVAYQQNRQRAISTFCSPKQQQPAATE